VSNGRPHGLSLGPVATLRPAPVAANEHPSPPEVGIEYPLWLLCPVIFHTSIISWPIFGLSIPGTATVGAQADDQGV
jgi:hypothetical protein